MGQTLEKAFKVDKEKLEICARALYAYDAEWADSRWASWPRATVAKQNKYLERAYVVLEATGVLA